MATKNRLERLERRQPRRKPRNPWLELVETAPGCYHCEKGKCDYTEADLAGLQERFRLLIVALPEGQEEQAEGGVQGDIEE